MVQPLSLASLRSGLRPLLVAGAAVAVAATTLSLLPSLEVDLFAQVAAQLAGLFTGSPVQRVLGGWLLPQTTPPIAVTSACSATDFFVIVVALLAWQFARALRDVTSTLLLSLGCALPLTFAINAARIVAVTAAHRWFIPRLPMAYDGFLHMLTGAAVFLPSLILLSLCFEFHGRNRTSTVR
jgi:exosortase/archaeosortase family protein